MFALVTVVQTCALPILGQVAIAAVDRALRGETSPAPIYEGDYGILAILLGGPEMVCQVPLPEPGEPKRAILETYPKEHSAGYHGQALIDLAFRMRSKIQDVEAVEEIVLHSRRLDRKSTRLNSSH